MKADFRSIQIYWTALALTLLLAKLYDVRTIKMKKKYFLLAIMAVPFSILAGIRYGVGTDYFFYYNQFRGLTTVTLAEFLSKSIFEPIFPIITWISMNTIGSISFTFFIIEFVTLFTAFIAFDRLFDDEGKNITFAILLYYFLIFHLSLNISRQIMAISFFLMACVYLPSRNFKKYFLWCIIATLIHNSAMITVVIGALIMALNNYSGNSNSEVDYSENLESHSFKIQIRLRDLLFFLLIYGSLAIVPSLLNTFTYVSIFEKYTMYIHGDSDTSYGTVIRDTLQILPFILLGGRSIFQNKKYLSISRVILFLIPLSYSGYVANWASRLNLYPRALFAVFIAIITAKYSKVRNKQIIWIVYLYIFGNAYYSSILYLNNSSTFPFNFMP